jgi:hypothetical protein
MSALCHKQTFCAAAGPSYSITSSTVASSQVAYSNETGNALLLKPVHDTGKNGAERKRRNRSCLVRHWRWPKKHDRLNDHHSNTESYHAVATGSRYGACCSMITAEARNLINWLGLMHNGVPLIAALLCRTNCRLGSYEAPIRSPRAAALYQRVSEA